MVNFAALRSGPGPGSAPAAAGAAPVRYTSPGGDVFGPFLDLASRPHLLIAGATGSGKSVAINGIITSLLIAKTPNRARFILIDPKRVELKQFAVFPHCVRYASEPAEMLRALQWAVDEIDSRYRSMQAAGERDYNGPDLYVIIDELADLMTTQKKEVLPLLQRIGQVGRASSVHLIAATQNVLAVTIPTVLKCNFPAVVGLRTASRSQSRYLVDAPGCESLPDPKREGKGYAWIRDGADLWKQYIYRYPDSVLESLRSWWTSPACIVK